jgi:hypothetical protein
MRSYEQLREEGEICCFLFYTGRWQTFFLFQEGPYLFQPTNTGPKQLLSARYREAMRIDGLSFYDIYIIFIIN